MNTPNPRTSAAGRTISWTILRLALAMALFALAIVPVSAGVTGAIFTTNSGGTQVNGNLYLNKADVYLDGGPQPNAPCGAAGLDNGDYYFQVTNPSGSLDLSTPAPSSDAIASRRVTVFGGLIIAYVGNPGTHVPGTGKCNSISIALAPFNDTDNPGGEYKVWMTPVEKYDPTNCPHFGFCDKDSKTDNFKVQIAPPPPCTTDCGTAAPIAHLVACKYWDKDDDGRNEGSDTLLGDWVINAVATFAQISINGGGLSATGTTDATGCTTFNITGFPDFITPETITLTETQQTNWNQVAPLVGTYNGGTGGDITVAGNCPDASSLPANGTVPPCSSNISVPIKGDGSITVAPDFGNTGLDLTVAKTATPGFTRTYSWNITKCAKDPGSTNCVATPDKVDQVGGTATFNYSVTASETGFNDTGFAVSGQITVTNPNSFAVSGVTVSDDDSADFGTCPVTNGTGVTVAAGGSVQLDYSCSYSANPGSGTNTATATWTAATYNTPDGSAQGQQSFTFGSPTSTVNKTITVTDCFNGTVDSLGVCTGTGSAATTLGTLTATDATPYATHTYTYTHTINIPNFGCKTNPNTATIQETLLTSTAGVQVCGPEQTGALTMGYWQNKNGQGIISGGAYTVTGTVKVCNSGTWLRTFAPFQDLGATATCTQVGTYVTNIIKAATCSGTTTQPCNAMLKAQDLATSLDVYFGQGPGLASVSIDLTKICKMIDGSGGTATCSGSFEDTSSAFGANSLTVSQILTNAASYSNVGGTAWYGNVKATQVLAKDTFDAINNQIAFAP